MRGRRPHLFSDTVAEPEPPLSKAEFEHHLETLTARKDEERFERFARRLAEALRAGIRAGRYRALSGEALGAAIDALARAGASITGAGAATTGAGAATTGAGGATTGADAGSIVDAGAAWRSVRVAAGARLRGSGGGIVVDAPRARNGGGSGIRLGVSNSDWVAFSPFSRCANMEDISAPPRGSLPPLQRARWPAPP